MTNYANVIPNERQRSRSKFLESLKILFQDKEIEIVEIEIVVNDIDEKADLSKSETNRKILLQSIENIERRTNLVEVQEI